MAADGRMKRMTKESERRKREGEEVGEVTDEESVELWLVGGEKRGKNTQSGSKGGIAPEILPSSMRRWQGVGKWGVLNL